ncbi:MAG: TRAP transporter small permease [Selenomonadaceae bacterium]
MEKKKNNMLLILKNFDLFLAGVTLIVLVFVTFAGVIMRYFVDQPFAWEEEVQLLCFVWITFFGVGVAFRTGSHVSIEFIVDLMPEKIAWFIEFGGYILVMLVLLFFGYESCVIVKQMALMNRVTNILHIPYAVIYGVIPIGCVLMMYNYTKIMGKHLKNFRKDEVRE